MSDSSSASGSRRITSDSSSASGSRRITSLVDRLPFVDRDSGQDVAVTPGRPLLSAHGVEAAYDRVRVLFGVDLEVRPGEIVALLGTNGAGKSTFLKTVSGLLDPTGGTIRFGDRDITHADARTTARLGISQVPGGEAIFPSLTVEENLRVGSWLDRHHDDEVRAATAEIYELFPRLAERRRQPAGDLSGGERQMLGLSMAFLGRPKLLMVDELSLGLAPTIVAELLDVVREFRDRGVAVVVVEQSISVALMLAERAYFMEKGEVRFEGPAADLLERDDIVRSVFLEGATAMTGGDGHAGAPPADATPTVGADDATTAEMAVVTGDSHLLVADGLTKRFGGITAVDGVGFHVDRGEILGVIGPNGAGKTTLFDLVSGYLTPDEGTVALDGEDLLARKPHERAWLGLGRSFQHARLVPSLTVAENLAIALERHLEWRDHVASSLALPEIVLLERDVAFTVAELVEMMGLVAYRDKFVRELSTGTRRVVDLAMVVAMGPRVLLLDEPSSGIAQRETEALGPLLQHIQRRTGCSLLVVEHDMPLITSIADRLVAMDLGRTVTEGPPQAVVSDPRVVESYLGGDADELRRAGGAA